VSCGRGGEPPLEVVDLGVQRIEERAQRARNELDVVLVDHDCASP
jgi:hypothetical protein